MEDRPSCQFPRRRTVSVSAPFLTFRSLFWRKHKSGLCAEKDRKVRGLGRWEERGKFQIYRLPVKTLGPSQWASRPLPMPHLDFSPTWHEIKQVYLRMSELYVSAEEMENLACGYDIPHSIPFPRPRFQTRAGDFRYSHLSHTCLLFFSSPRLQKRSCLGCWSCRRATSSASTPSCPCPPYLAP